MRLLGDAYASSRTHMRDQPDCLGVPKCTRVYYGVPKGIRNIGSQQSGRSRICVSEETQMRILRGDADLLHP